MRQGRLVTSVAGRPSALFCVSEQDQAMFIIGIILVIVGLVLAIPILWIIGAVLAAVGLTLELRYRGAPAAAPRRRWY